MAFGSILGGFGEDLDASWENLGIQNSSFCVTWSFLEHSGCPLLPHTLLQEPPRCLASPRGASQLIFLKFQIFGSKIGPNGT